jgi:hypothetical protein
VTLGGTHAISYRIGALFLPFLILSVPATEGDISRELFLQWTIVSSLSLLLTGFLLVTLDKTILSNRYRNPISNNTLFLLGAGIGVVRGFMTFLFARVIFHIPSETYTNGVIRIINSAVIGSISIPLIALISFSYFEISKSRIESRSLLIGIDQLITAQPDDESQGAIFQEVLSRLRISQAEILEYSQRKSLPDKSKLANYLRELSTNIIRPLSHRIATTAKSQPSKIKILFNSLLLIPDNLWGHWQWLLCFYCVGEIRIDLRELGLLRGLIFTTLSSSIFMALIAVLAQIFKSTKPSISKAMALPLIAGLLNAISSIGTHKLIGESLARQSFFLSFAWSSFLLYAIPFAGSFVTTDLQDIEKTNSKYFRRFQSVTTQVNTYNTVSSNLARFLHGSLQTKLNTSAFRISNAVDENTLREELKFVASYLILPNFEMIDEINAPIQNRLETIKELWLPLIVVNFEKISLDLCSDPSALRSLCDLVNEAVANANRHGDATTITFSIESHDSIISIEASNDGALVGLGKPGLGSRIYDSATNKNWQLSNINDRVTLIARIPIQKEEI